MKKRKRVQLTRDELIERERAFQKKHERKIFLLMEIKGWSRTQAIKAIACQSDVLSHFSEEGSGDMLRYSIGVLGEINKFKNQKNEKFKNEN